MRTGPSTITPDTVHHNSISESQESVSADPATKPGAKPASLFSLANLARSLPALDEVEKLIASKFASDAEMLTRISQYLFSIGGKRIRPLITLLTGELFGLKKSPQALVDVAAGIELIHMATLLHDDIIDKSPLRRHTKSPFAEFGTETTLLTGDFLLTRAFSLCARLDTFIIDCTESACVALTEGEILEVPLFEAKHTIQSSTTIARKKTAALFRLGSQSAAHLANAGDAATAAMAEFGDAIGTAFQILDDVLDVVASEDVLGKKSGLDILERKPSLVNVLWLESESPLARRLLERPSANEDAFIAAALKELRGGDVVREARKIADEFAAQAKDAMARACAAAPHHDEATYGRYLQLIDYTLQRLS